MDRSAKEQPFTVSAHPVASDPRRDVPLSVAVAADHGGFALKNELMQRLQQVGHEVRDFGATALSPEDDYPDFIIPMACAVASGTPSRGVAICGSGVGACIAANKVPRVRAGLCTDVETIRQGVERDSMNVLCIGGRTTDVDVAWRLVQAFLNARFSDEERYRRRLETTAELERRS